MKKRKSNIDWKISDEKIFWAATVMILALLTAMLCSCKTHKESTVDYEVTSSESYQERKAEEQERRMSVITAEKRDTVKETAARSGRIEIERDTAGRTIKIVYEHNFDGFLTQGSSRIDTVLQKQVIVLKDSTGNGKTDTEVDGHIKEKKDGGFTLIGVGAVSLFVCISLIVLYILVKRHLRRWEK